ncbi:MAG TPA: glycosyltransferase family 1 protein [Streptosporangiaceae bacterium]|nr:glycosyltransferase family 1 protein [Streptosporangiaceae bacterium]
MARDRRAILVDARVNGFPGAHGIARSVMKLAAHFERGNDELALKVLVNPGRPQIFPLSELPAHAELVSTDITLGAVHRCVELARLIRSAGAAVLYVPFPPFTPLILPCPIVVTLHDCMQEGQAAFAGGWHRQTALKVATSVVVRRAAAITAPSSATLADIRWRYPSAPCPTLVPNGVDIGQFAPATAADIAAARDLYGLPEHYILAVGALRPHKNHEVLVRSLQALPTRESLVIVGCPDPTFPLRLPDLIASLGLQNRVRLVPDVADRWLPAVYSAASVFALPSLAEGFGIPVLEAMACGVPVVASDIPPLAEVTRGAALLVAPRDVHGWTTVLGNVLADRALSDRLARSGAEVARSVTWRRGAAALRSLLADAAGEGLPERDMPAPDWQTAPGAAAR